jgi:putative ATP-dependent endonuclease of OLD family
LQETMPSTKRVKIEIKVPTVPELVQVGTSLALDDGIETRVESKGHGLQRALILAMLRVFAEFLKSAVETGKNVPCFVFAIEEPELYLHPQCQRMMFETLESISEIDEIIFCTHSSFFIDMSHYNSLVVVSKPDLAKGTELLQCTKEIFPPEEKGHFKMINEFDPERNELFFAKKVVLVEGDSEKVAFPRIFRIMGENLNSKCISIIECGSKFNICFFMKVLNEFKIPYVVVHDEDPVAPNLEGDKLEAANRLFGENNKIQATLNPEIGRIEMLRPDFDHVLGLSQHQMEINGKPYTAFLKLKEMRREEIPMRLQEIVLALST